MHYSVETPALESRFLYVQSLSPDISRLSFAIRATYTRMMHLTHTRTPADPYLKSIDEQLKSVCIWPYNPLQAKNSWEEGNFLRETKERGNDEETKRWMGTSRSLRGVAEPLF